MANLQCSKPAQGVWLLYQCLARSLVCGWGFLQLSGHGYAPLAPPE